MIIFFAVSQDFFKNFEIITVSRIITAMLIIIVPVTDPKISIKFSSLCIIIVHILLPDNADKKAVIDKYTIDVQTLTAVLLGLKII